MRNALSAISFGVLACLGVILLFPSTAQTCEPDCTTTGGDEILAACSGVNGCSFYDSTAATACDHTKEGWLRNYSGGDYVTCPDGSPQSYENLSPGVSCSGTTIVKRPSLVMYKGKPATMVVVSCVD